ncbi:MAG: efflux RND transporter periplasmic adaptor subunit [Thermodesulfobacteriota bacterium]|nr:efflux RND transporter periplasmic adaptor subunit [Thermodesulfobacteriota bacterium]
MKRYLTRLIWIAVIIVVGFVVYRAFITTKKGEDVKEKKAIPVVIASVSSDSISELLEISGEIKANKSVVITSKVPGRLEQLQTRSSAGKTIEVKEGLRVKKDQKIAIIDHDQYLAQVRRAEAALSVAKANLDAAKVTLEDARKEKDRWVNLAEKGFATEQKRDTTLANYDRAVAARALAEAGVSEAQAVLDLARIQFRESTIVSPLTGVVTKKHIDEGNMIGTSTPIVTIEDIQTIKVVVGVPERYLKKIKPGETRAYIKVDAFPDKDFSATVEDIYPAVDRQTRTVQIELKVANEENFLRPGMYARIVFTLAHKAETIVVPCDTVLGHEGKKRYVYVIKSSVAHKVPVKLGLKQGEFVEVAEGLKPGDKLVINGMNYLKDGDAVEVVEGEGEK